MQDSEHPAYWRVWRNLSALGPVLRQLKALIRSGSYYVTKLCTTINCSSWSLVMWFAKFGYILAFMVDKVCIAFVELDRTINYQLKMISSIPWHHLGKDDLQSDMLWLLIRKDITALLVVAYMQIAKSNSITLHLCILVGKFDAEGTYRGSSPG